MKKVLIATYNFPPMGGGGVSEAVVDGVTDFLIDPNDISQLTDKIVDVLLNEQKARQLDKNGRKFVEDNYGWDRVEQRLYNYLISVQ